MSKYTVPLKTGAYAFVTVEADSAEDAVDAVFNGDLPWVCAQCSGWGRQFSLELGDWDVDDDAEIVAVES